MVVEEGGRNSYMGDPHRVAVVTVHFDSHDSEPCRWMELEIVSPAGRTDHCQSHIGLLRGCLAFLVYDSSSAGVIISVLATCRETYRRFLESRVSRLSRLSR